MGEAWTSRMQLVTDSRERMARLLNAANTREGLMTPRSAGRVTAHVHVGLCVFRLRSVATGVLTFRGIDALCGSTDALVSERISE